MQTFLPFSSFADSARALDNKRLSKQLVEVQQIARALTDPDYGWQHHPAVSMWRGHIDALFAYGEACYVEWMRRWHDSERGGKIGHKSGDWILKFVTDEPALPPWFGDERFHSSHQAALLAKDPEWYGRFGWEEEPGIDYFWPGSGGTE